MCNVCNRSDRCFVREEIWLPDLVNCSVAKLVFTLVAGAMTRWSRIWLKKIEEP
jgi:hypothetical protein